MRMPIYVPRRALQPREASKAVVLMPSGLGKFAGGVAIEPPDGELVKKGGFLNEWRSGATGAAVAPAAVKRRRRPLCSGINFGITNPACVRAQNTGPVFMIAES